LDGLTLVGKLRAAGIQTPILFLTTLGGVPGTVPCPGPFHHQSAVAAKRHRYGWVRSEDSVQYECIQWCSAVDMSN